MNFITKKMACRRLYERGEHGQHIRYINNATKAKKKATLSPHTTTNTAPHIAGTQKLTQSKQQYIYK